MKNDSKISLTSEDVTVLEKIQIGIQKHQNPTIDIADALNISIRAASEYQEKLRQKLGASNNSKLIEIAIKNGYIQELIQEDLTQEPIGQEESDSQKKTHVISNLQVENDPIMSGECPICKLNLELTKAAKVIDIYSYTYTDEKVFLDNIKRTYNEFKLHQFGICRECSAKDEKGLKGKIGFGFSTIFFFLLGYLLSDENMFDSGSGKIFGILFAGSIVMLAYFIIQYQPIEKKLIRVVTTRRKPTTKNLIVNNEADFRLFIERYKKCNPTFN